MIVRKEYLLCGLPVLFIGIAAVVFCKLLEPDPRMTVDFNGVNRIVKVLDSRPIVTTTDRFYLPPVMAPGVIEPSVTVEQLSDPDFIREDRHVPASLKREIFGRDGIDWNSKRSDVEVDHIVPKCLGGADVAKNLWCEFWEGDWNAHDKDRVEVAMHRLVQSGKLDLRQAQKEIAANWIDCYRRYCGEKN